jgi:uncharacterized membrane protein
MTTTTTLHPLAADYLGRLERAARRLPRGERRELVEEITAHLSEATNPDMSDAEALTVLDAPVATNRARYAPRDG